MIKWVVFFLLVVLASSEVMMEVCFDLALKEQTETGFKPTDALNMYLQSKSMKWLRSFHMLVSGQVSKPQRVAFLAFKDVHSWAEFEEEHLVKTHALFDHFWLNSRRVLWTEVADENLQFPIRSRSMEKTGGFMWQLKYTVSFGKENEWKEFLDDIFKKAIEEVNVNEAFVEGHNYDGKNLQHTFQHMILWEFLSMGGLSDGVLESPTMAVFYTNLPKYCSDWNSAILAPPTDENGKQIGYFYPAAGADTTAEKEDL
jgi:hypothetical protein